MTYTAVRAKPMNRDRSVELPNVLVVTVPSHNMHDILPSQNRFADYAQNGMKVDMSRFMVIMKCSGST